uniref:Uncharacterized protein n=1 Tax=Tolypothrix bouteillei VB521301 TaxID=1479485 RepID=A0A0C1R7G3_9CYAN
MNFLKTLETGINRLATGIENFGESIYRTIKESREHHEESVSLGLISDDEKLLLLKAELYRQARLTEGKINNLVSAIATLEQVKQAEFDRKQSELKQRLSFPSQLEATCSLAIVLVIALIAGSYFATYKCGKSRSQFCSNARVIPTQIEMFFKD